MAETQGWDGASFDILRTLIEIAIPSNGYILGRLCCTCKSWKAGLYTFLDLWNSLASATPKLSLKDHGSGSSASVADGASLRSHLNEFSRLEKRLRDGHANVWDMLSFHAPHVWGRPALLSDGSSSEQPETPVAEESINSDIRRRYDWMSDISCSGDSDSRPQVDIYHNTGSDLILVLQSDGSSFARETWHAFLAHAQEPSKAILEVLPFDHSLEGLQEALSGEFWLLGSRFIMPDCRTSLTAITRYSCTAFDLETRKSFKMDFSRACRANTLECTITSAANPHQDYPLVAILKVDDGSLPSVVTTRGAPKKNSQPLPPDAPDLPPCVVTIFNVKTRKYCLQHFPINRCTRRPRLFEFVGPYLFVSNESDDESDGCYPFYVYEFNGGQSGGKAWELVRSTTFSGLGACPEIHSVQGSAATLSAFVGSSREILLVSLATGKVISRRRAARAFVCHATSRFFAVGEFESCADEVGVAGVDDRKSLAVYDIFAPDSSPPLLRLHCENLISFVGVGRMVVSHRNKGLQIWDFVSPFIPMDEARINCCALSQCQLTSLPDNPLADWEAPKVEVDAKMEMVSIPVYGLEEHVSRLLCCTKEELQVRVLAKYSCRLRLLALTRAPSPPAALHAETFVASVSAARTWAMEDKARTLTVLPLRFAGPLLPENLEVYRSPKWDWFHKHGFAAGDVLVEDLRIDPARPFETVLFRYLDGSFYPIDPISAFLYVKKLSVGDSEDFDALEETQDPGDW